MQALSREIIAELLESQAGPCVSIYMPTHRAGPDTRQDPILLKNLLRQAEKTLAEQYPDSCEPSELLEPAWVLVDDFQYWQHQLDGLAIFVAPGLFQNFSLPHKFEAAVSVAGRFMITPLLPLLAEMGEFYLLALSQKDTCLYHGSRLDLTKMELKDTPHSLEEALRFDDPEAQLQLYITMAPQPNSAGGEQQALYHGHGGSSADDEANLRRFFHQLNAGVHRILRDQEAPLLLAGVGYQLPIYREVNTYPNLAEPALIGNPHEMGLDELHEQAWQIVQPLFLQQQEDSLERYLNLQATQMTGTAIDEIVPAAVNGRIETLFVQQFARVWGQYQPDTNRVEVHPERQTGDTDLVGLAVAKVLENGGIVYMLEAEDMPSHSQIAAIFRYTYQNQEV